MEEGVYSWNLMYVSGTPGWKKTGSVCHPLALPMAARSSVTSSPSSTGHVGEQWIASGTWYDWKQPFCQVIFQTAWLSLKSSGHKHLHLHNRDGEEGVRKEAWDCSNCYKPHSWIRNHSGKPVPRFFSTSWEMKVVIISLLQSHIKAKWGTEDYKKEVINLCFLWRSAVFFWMIFCLVWALCVLQLWDCWRAALGSTYTLVSTVSNGKQELMPAWVMFCRMACSSFPSGSLWTLVCLLSAREGVTQLTTTMERTTGREEMPRFFFRNPRPPPPPQTLKVCNCRQLFCTEAASAIFRSSRTGEDVTNKLKTVFIWERAKSEKPGFLQS